MGRPEGPGPTDDLEETAISPLVYIAFFAAIALMVLRYPVLGVTVMMLTYVLEQFFMANMAWLYSQQQLTNLVCGGIVLWALFLRFAKGHPIFQNRPRELYVVMALYGLCGISTLWSLYDGAFEMFRSYLPILIAFGFIAPLVMLSVRDLKFLFFSYLAFAAVLVPAFLINSEWAGRSIILKGGVGVGGLVGDRGNPLAVATFGGYTAIIASLIRVRRFGWLMIVLQYTLAAAGCYLCMTTASRGQAFALAAGILTFLPLSLRMNSIGRIIGLMVSLGIVLIVGSYIAEDFAQRDENRWRYGEFFSDWSNDRLQTALILLRAWAEAGPAAWLLGLGNNASYAIPGLNFYCHVVMAEVLGEEGLVGFILLWLVPIFFAMSFLAVYRRVRDYPVERGVLAALGGIFLFETVISFKQGSMLGSEGAFALAIIMGRIRWTMLREEQAYAALDDQYHEQMLEEEARAAEEEHAEQEPALAGAR